MFFKKIKKACLTLLLSLFIIPINALAYSDYVIAGGENIGIELKAKGIIVVGVYKVGDNYPASEAGIKVGDIITSINDETVANISELSSKINTRGEDNIKIGYIRNNISDYTNLKLYKDNDVYKTGLYVKDSISGIGTLTYIDPNTRLFGALGHEIIEKSTGKILEVKDGKIYASSVTNIEPSVNGVPGEKNAKLNSDEVLGDIFENTSKGIFGNYKLETNTGKLYKVGKISDIKKGDAIIRTVIDKENVEEFTINIIKINNNGETKNIVFEITDKKLLEKTGGIVQGMSGSPIIQGDFIIGAVTHVVVDDTTKGYGILITNMLEEAEN